MVEPVSNMQYNGIWQTSMVAILVTDTVEKADILNNQFQSVFTNETDTYIQEKGHSPQSKIPQINITRCFKGVHAPVSG
jgi:hypothetical protein